MFLYNPAHQAVVSTEAPVYFTLGTTGQLTYYGSEGEAQLVGLFGNPAAAIAALRNAGVAIVEISDPE